MSDKLFLTAIELKGTGAHPQAWRRPDSRAEDLYTAGFWVDQLQAADRAGVDLAFLGDSFASRTLEAAAIAARVAALTEKIGLVPTITVTHTEPFHISKQIASLDFASHGRAGWQVEVSPGAEQAALFGRKAEQDNDSLWREADEAIEVVTRLWDSWEDDAEIRDVESGRFIDRDKLHYIDFEGENFSVKGPSITPRSPQGQPLVVIRGDSTESVSVAAARAGIVRIVADTVDDAATTAARIRRAVVAEGRDPADVFVLLDVETLVSNYAAEELAQLDNWAGNVRAAESVSHIGDLAGLHLLLGSIEAAGLDGVTLVPLALPSGIRSLPATDNRSGSTLRERLGLTRPANRYALEGKSL
ncbi:LLM class flavin-dependent oxidoreductase [Rhodococcus sp. IEGM 1381]|uniref:LLM class flavin-dependent oxidoreductase n=1 Tax=Rhodococcus sp. IEGM 1381 TaxID=3047085 RepID=UPI0024B848A1|nr:LLM class flavin-dependent oxidoreductase [Rhodococcus sp. IEGM 1381]MDI9897483.1 LLM class flavin-dependent oxidoreductase [Rhodococcus sp. IEGM 1381]